MGIFTRKKKPTFADDICAYFDAIFATISSQLAEDDVDINLQLGYKLHIIGILMYYIVQFASLEYALQVLKLYCDTRFGADKYAAAEYYIQISYSKTVEDANSILNSGGNINDIFDAQAKLTCDVMNLEVTSDSIDFFVLIFAEFVNHISQGKKVWNVE